MPDVVPTRSTEPERPQLVDYGGDAGAVRRWARGTFTRENVLSGLKTLAWVAPLTVLIWVYAEREQLFKEQSVPIPIKVSSGDPTRVVTLVHPPDNMILADLEGPRSKIDDLRDEFSRGGGVESLNLPVDPLKLAPGKHELRTASLVGGQPMFERNGIVVSNCQPPTLHVIIDEYETREVTIEPPPAVTNLVGTPIFEPAKVKIRAPRNEFDRAGDLKVYADLASVPELASPGSHTGLNVRVYTDAPSGPNVSLAPGMVKATVEVRQSDEEYTMPFMAVVPMMPMAMQKQYSVDGPDTIQNVTVIGPADKIALLKRAQEDPAAAQAYYAVVEVNGDDRPAEGQTVGPVRTRQLRYDLALPPGVRVAPDVQRSIEFKLVRRGPDG
jgi:hypothetical protein